MSRIQKIFYYSFPVFFLILPALLGLGIEVYNLYFRHISTPFLWPAIGLLLLSIFFWVRRLWQYLVLLAINLGFWLYFFMVIFANSLAPRAIVYYYQSWAFQTTTGRLQLKTPLGQHTPDHGPYVGCHFALLGWRDYLDNQPVLCTALNDELRIEMYLNDQEIDSGFVREFHWNRYQVDRKSLLGEALDRSGLRITYLHAPEEKLWKTYRIESIYQVYEREIAAGVTRIVESFSRDAEGRLLSFTESPLLKLNDQDAYATYNRQGILSKIPKMREKSFSFPARVEIRSVEKLDLPERIGSSENE